MVESTAPDQSPRARSHSPRSQRLKELLFAAFIVLSVVLIGLIWLENGRGDNSSTPRFYRDTFVMDASAYATVTAEAAAAEPVRTPTP